jgi:hypothetical protein
MRRRAPRAALLVATMIMVAALVHAGTAHAGGPGVWTKIAKVDNGFDYPGMFRTSDGRLHVVWRKKLLNNNFAYGYTTVALNGATLNTGTALSNWESLEEDPVLVHHGSGMRLLFKGSRDTSGDFFSRGSVYTLTSTNGTTWNLPQETVMQQNTLNGTFAGTAEQDDTPVAVATLNQTLYYHEGTDSSAPAAAADKTATLSSGDYFNQSAVTANDGSVWIAYFRDFASTASANGYYVQQILPTKGQPMKAPSSFNASVDNEPRQPVALAARNGGGVFLAYCAPTSTKACAHVDLWKVGTSTPKVVPGTSSGSITRVALADGLAGRISVVTGDPGRGKINAVRTNTTVSAFGVVRTINMPPDWFNFNTLEAEGTFGRLDIVANVLVATSPNPIFLFHTQILAGLSLTASPSKFSHTSAHTVTFTVKDASQPVSGAKVSCIGKSDLTNSSGIATITFPKGTATGKHVCTASKANYNPGKTTITVT